MFNFTGRNTFPATVPVLEDGDLPDAATFAAALEGLTDRTFWLHARRIKALLYSTIVGGSDQVIAGGVFVPIEGGLLVQLPGAKAGDTIVVVAALEYQATFAEQQNASRFAFAIGESVHAPVEGSESQWQGLGLALNTHEQFGVLEVPSNGTCSVLVEWKNDGVNDLDFKGEGILIAALIGTGAS